MALNMLSTTPDPGVTVSDPEILDFNVNNVIHYLYILFLSIKLKFTLKRLSFREPKHSITARYFEFHKFPRNIFTRFF
jgi:hypothetical protein